MPNLKLYLERTAFTNARARVVCKEFGIKLYSDAEIEEPERFFAKK
jgi:hypothetical protein